MPPDIALRETGYARSGDVSIAYRVIGTGPGDKVVVPAIVSNIEMLQNANRRIRCSVA
jgi:hypothetical protein